MYSALEHLCQVAAIAGVPALLIAKFQWRHRIPWWSVILAVAISSTALGVAVDLLGRLAHFEGFDACVQALAPDSQLADCGFGTYDVSYIPIHLKWISGMLLLAVFSPFYGLAVWLRARSRRASAT